MEEVGRGDGAGAHGKRRQGAVRRRLEAPVAVVQVEPRLVFRRVGGKRVSTLCDKQVRGAVAGGVEEEDRAVVGPVGRCDRRRVAGREPPIGALAQDPQGVERRAAHDHVVAALAVHVADRKGRPAPVESNRDEALLVRLVHDLLPRGEG